MRRGLKPSETQNTMQETFAGSAACPIKRKKASLVFAAAGRLRSPAFLRREPMKPFSVTTTLH